ncbi:MAG TPA: TadE/TadG family type IV pilus assembly protein, partial [Ilumatobacteraceae bacterium]
MLPRPRPRDRGQATVELALCLPLLFLFLLGIVQLVVVVRDQLAIELAAREAARAASVTTSADAAAQSAAEQAVSLRPLLVSTGASDTTVSVTVSHVTRTDVPLIGALVPD